MWRFWLVAGTIGVVLAGAPWGVAAQKGRGPKTPQKERVRGERFRGKATIDSISGDVMKITSDGESLSAKPVKDAKIRVVGRAERSYLRVGQYVQIRALVDKKGKRLKDPAQRLTVFTASNEFTPGLVPDPSGAAAAEAITDLSVDWKPYFVAGAISHIDENQLTMSVPGFLSKLKVDLAEKLVIEVNLDDLRLVKPGDTLDVRKGKKEGGVVHVAEGTIRLAKPLGATDKSSSGAAKPPARGKR
jgi:hypothetical protein